jgi:hypothetical protein
VILEEVTNGMIPSSSNSINFACPSCNTQLSVPASMAGVTGPCPTCQNQLTSPLPEDLGQQTVPALPVQQQPAQNQQVAPAQAPSGQQQAPPVQQQAPVQAQQQAAAPDFQLPILSPAQQSQQAPGPSQLPPDLEHPVPKREPRTERRHRSEKTKPKRALSGKVIAGLAAVGLLAGTAIAVPKVMEFFGNASAEGPKTAQASGDVIPKPPNPPPSNKVPNGPQPPADGHVFHGTKPTLEEEPKLAHLEDEPAALDGILDEPREFLEAFLTSPKWEDLLPKSLNGDSHRAEMATYYKANPYEPEKVLEMTFQHKQKLPDSDKQFYLFKVITASNKGSFPMTVEETSTGFRTDWQAYVQFKDSHLQKFLDNPKVGKDGKGEIKSFNVIMRRAHDFTDEVPDSENKWCYKIDAPVDNLPGGFCFIPKYSKYGKELDTSLKWLLLYFPIVELRWETDTDKPDKPYVRLMKIRQFNWRGHDPNAVKLEALDALTEASQN